MDIKALILAFLKTKLTGVQEAYLTGVADTFSKTITEESQIETVLNDGVIETLKFSATHAQSEGDRRATEAQKTAVANYEKKHNLKEGKPVEKGDDTPPATSTDPNDITTIVQNAVKAAVEPLQQKLESKEKAESQEALRKKVIGKVTEGKSDADKKILASYLDGRTIAIEKEEDINTVVTGLNESFTGFKQTLVDANVIVDVPQGGDGSSSLKTDLDGWASENKEQKN